MFELCLRRAPTETSPPYWFAGYVQSSLSSPFGPAVIISTALCADKVAGAVGLGDGVGVGLGDGVGVGLGDGVGVGLGAGLGDDARVENVSVALCA